MATFYNLHFAMICAPLKHCMPTSWRRSRPFSLMLKAEVHGNDCKPCVQGVPTLEGLAVIDVVEGTARAALPHMAAVLAARPSAFPSLRAALDWAKRSGAAKAQAHFPLQGQGCAAARWDHLQVGM